MTATDDRALKIQGVRKRFDATMALDGFDLELHRGTILALLGPSGCGKTTALRVAIGLDRPEAGEVWVGDRLVTGSEIFVPPEHRRIGMVFQEWALFPHLDVWNNVAFGLARGEDDRVREVLTQVGLLGLERRMPYELSGGQQQRVALARALAPSPEVLLLDEPFSNLDAALRVRVRTEVRDLLRREGATALFVTHDQEEALAVADEVAVMDRGRVLQVGAPYEIYTHPASLEVASLLGEANVLSGAVREGHVWTALGTVPAGGVDDGPVRVVVRPEWVLVQPDPTSESIVTEVEYYGHDRMVAVRLSDGTTVRSRSVGPQPEIHARMAVRVSLSGPVRLFPHGTLSRRPSEAKLPR